MVLTVSLLVSPIYEELASKKKPVKVELGFNINKVLYLNMAMILNNTEYLEMTRRILENIKLDCHFDMTTNLESIELRKKKQRLKKVRNKI